MKCEKPVVDWMIGAGIGTFFGCLLYAGICNWIDQRDYQQAMADTPAPARKKEPTRDLYGNPYTMTACWYGSAYQGRKTSSGQIFDPEKLTAAHKTLPFGTKLLIRHLDREVEVTVTDRGPFAEGRDLDLSAAAFRQLAPLERGVIQVQVRRAP